MPSKEEGKPFKPERTNNMDIIKRAFLTLILSITIIAIAMNIAGAQAEEYKMYGTIIELDENQGIVYFIDQQDEIWSFYGEGWEIGQVIIVTMENMNTINIYDDEVRLVLSYEWVTNNPFFFFWMLNI